MADKREETPDILGDVLDEDADAAAGQTDASEESPDEQGREEADQSKEEGGTDDADDMDEVPKRKATYYLREDTLDKLEEAWFRLRQRADEGEKRSVSKSAIVEAAIEAAIEELNTDEKGSAIVQRLLE